MARSTLKVLVFHWCAAKRLAFVDYALTDERRSVIFAPVRREEDVLVANRPNAFDEAFGAQLRDLLRWRRDVRRFRRDRLPVGTLENLIELGCLAPSVGLSQPWRFVVVDDQTLRAEVRQVFASCNAEALAAQSPSRAALYARLKLAGLEEAPSHLAVFADRGAEQGHGLGSRTMPEMIEYSVVTAVHTMWLAARAQGIGMGWISILDPQKVAAVLDVPSDWKFIGYFCFGYPENEGAIPELEQLGWEERRPAVTFVIRR